MEEVHISVGGSDQQSPWKGSVGPLKGVHELSAPCHLLEGTALPKETGPEERGWQGKGALQSASCEGEGSEPATFVSGMRSRGG